MKIFVTGVTGFIGGHFLNQAFAAGHRAVAVRRPGSVSRMPLSHEPVWVQGNLDADWSKELSECRALVHFVDAGVAPRKADWADLFDLNVRQSLDLWNRAVAAGVKRFVICGSCIEYGKSGERTDFIKPETPLEPSDAHAASKAAATMAALALAVEKQVDVIVLRPFEVFGEGQPESLFWPSLRKAALAGEDFAMTAGEQMRDFVSAEKVADAFVAALTRTDLHAGQPKIENVGSSRPMTLRAFAEHWWTLLGAKGRLKIGARPYRPHEVMRYIPAVQVSNPMFY